VKNLFIPNPENNYTPHLLSRGLVTFYTLVILLFNIVTSDISVLKAHADVDTKSIVELHNLERRKHSLSQFKVNSKLVNSAKLKAKAMLESNCWDHYCPNGKSPWDFFDEAGYSYIYAGENLAEGFNDNEDVMQAWMNSKTHRENILRGEFDEIGIGIVYGDYQNITNNAIIVVHFGSQKQPTNTTATKPATTPNDGTVKITYPSDGALINSNTPEVKGTGPTGQVSIYDNNTRLGKARILEGIFTYNIQREQALVEGEHTIKAVADVNSALDSVKIRVDTISPSVQGLEFDSVIKDEKDVVTLRAIVSEDTSSITTDSKDVKFMQKNATTWEAEIELGKLNKLSSILINLYDDATNKSTKQFPLNEIKGVADMEAKNLISTDNSVGFIEKMGVRRIANIIFISFIMALIAIDYYALINTNLPTGFVRAKTHYHLSMFAILLFISIFSSTAGELLDGRST